MKPLRLGFLSTAGIGRKNWKAIRNSGNCIITAVASRDIARARAFIADCQREHPFAAAPAALGSYDELLASPAVDAVYIPLPTGLRKDFVIRAAQNGKHVLCEKPCAGSAAELEEMLAACRKNSVQFLDGVMFMHSPRLARVREVLDDGRSVGPIRRLSSAFSFYPGEDFFRTNIRVDGALEPFGSLGDLGWYCLRFTLWALHWRLPETVAGWVLSASENLPGRVSAPTEFCATLFYPGGVTSDLYASFHAGNQQWTHVSGQNGWLRLPDFIHPLNSYEPAFEVNDQMITVPGEVKCPPGADPVDIGHATAQDARMWRSFANQIFTGRLNDEWPMWSLQTQLVLDACLDSAKRNTPVRLRR
ncbi:MAG: Gfo/Idh/MocA family oxidoreductase [Verrucomicrobiota bacterium]|jgi:predicted dehydrogenase